MIFIKLQGGLGGKHTVRQDPVRQVGENSEKGLETQSRPSPKKMRMEKVELGVSVGNPGQPFQKGT